MYNVQVVSFKVLGKKQNVTKSWSEMKKMYQIGGVLQVRNILIQLCIFQTVTVAQLRKANLSYSRTGQMSVSAEFSAYNSAQDHGQVDTGEVKETTHANPEAEFACGCKTCLVSVAGDSIAPQAGKCDCFVLETDLMLKPRICSITVVCFYFSREKEQ